METNETVSGKHPRESDNDSNICDEDISADWEHIGEGQVQACCSLHCFQ